MSFDMKVLETHLALKIILWLTNCLVSSTFKKSIIIIKTPFQFQAFYYSFANQNNVNDVITRFDFLHSFMVCAQTSNFQVHG